jgi:peptidyl-prolyl cis-trans isomerase SurA
MNKLRWFLLWSMIGSLPCPTAFAAATASPTRIVVVVNKEAITASDVAERIRLINLSSGKLVNAPVPNDVRKQIIQGMVDESLQLQLTKQKKIVVPDADVEASLTGLAKDNHMNLDGMIAMLKSNGISKKTMMARIRAQIAWARYIREVHGFQVHITDKQIDQALERAKTVKPEPLPQDFMDITLCQATFPVSPDTPPEIMEVMGPKIEETHQAQGHQAFIKTASEFGAKVEGNRTVKLGQLPETLKDAVLKTKVGSCIHPIMTPEGLVLTMVSARNMPKAPILEPTREGASQELENRELGKRSAQEMAKLKTAAFIDWKEEPVPQKPVEGKRIGVQGG